MHARRNCEEHLKRRLSLLKRQNISLASIATRVFSDYLERCQSSGREVKLRLPKGAFGARTPTTRPRVASAHTSALAILNLTPTVRRFRTSRQRRPDPPPPPPHAYHKSVANMASQSVQCFGKKKTATGTLPLPSSPAWNRNS